MARVALALDRRLGWEPCGWKIGAASEDIRRSEGVPSPSPRRLYRRGLFLSPANIPAELFVNYRNCECEFALELDLDFPARERAWTEADTVRAEFAGLGAVEAKFL